jgi:hypothetical protein
MQLTFERKNMKKSTLLLLFPLLLFTEMASAQETVQQKFKKLQWLSGKWIRTNNQPGQSGYETWKKVSNVKLTGKGVTFQGKKVHFIEELQFIAKESDLYYVVKVSGEPEPTYFKLTTLTGDSFTCENPEHDFPKKISYKKDGNQIKAVISGGGKQIDYLFTKQP